MSARLSRAWPPWPASSPALSAIGGGLYAALRQRDLRHPRVHVDQGRLRCPARTSWSGSASSWSSAASSPSMARRSASASSAPPPSSASSACTIAAAPWVVATRCAAAGSRTSTTGARPGCSPGSRASSRGCRCRSRSSSTTRRRRDRPVPAAAARLRLPATSDERGGAARAPRPSPFSGTYVPPALTLSSRIVTGPSLSSSTCMCAPNTPVCTGTPSARSAAT